MEHTIAKAGLCETIRQSRAGWLPFFKYLTETHGRVVKIPAPMGKLYYISDAQMIEDIQVSGHSKVTKSDLYKLVQLAIGLGVLTADGALWRQQRKLLQPLFTRKSVRTYAPLILEIVEETLTSLDQEAGGREFELSPYSVHFTVKVILDCVLGKTSRSDWSNISAALEQLFYYFEEITSKPFILPMFIPTRTNRGVKRCIREFNGAMEEFVAEVGGKEAEEGGANVVRYLRDHPSQNAQLILDEVKTLFVAGHDTTASIILWMHIELARHPDIQRRAFDSVKDIPHDDWEAFLDNKYLGQLIAELLRCYPTAWTYSRKTVTPIETCGVTFPQGATLIFDLYHAHRDERFFPNPHVFDPDRFQGKKSEHPDHYIPFGAGPRICMGNNLSLAELKLLAGRVLQSYSIELGESFHDGMRALVTLKPQNAPIILRPRGR